MHFKPFFIPSTQKIQHLVRYIFVDSTSHRQKKKKLDNKGVSFNF